MTIFTFVMRDRKGYDLEIRLASETYNEAVKNARTIMEGSQSVIDADEGLMLIGRYDLDDEENF